MALEHIIAALERELEDQVTDLRAQTAAEVTKLQEETEAAAEKVRSRTLDAIQPRLQTEQTQRINQARQDAQRTYLATQQELIEAVFAAAQVQLAEARRRSDFDAVMSALIGEVLDELGSPIHLEIDPKDAEIVHNLLAGRDHSVTVKPNLQTWGGVIGHTTDGRITVDNTLETRLAQTRERYRGRVASLLNEEALDAR